MHVKILLSNPAVHAGFGSAIGAAFYAGVLSPAQEIDWWRVAFMGVFCAVFTAIFSRKKQDGAE
jgi:hypothetical protein